MTEPKHTIENYRAADRLHERARQYRGRFLNHVAVIERTPANILTEYFCNDPTPAVHDW
jgi:hypothetical protein